MDFEIVREWEEMGFFQQSKPQMAVRRLGKEHVVQKADGDGRLERPVVLAFMQLLLVERHDDPTISGGWVAHVGSANERPGITGIAHLFEHMMFKGTPTLGTKDYQKDLEVIASQEKLREEMRKEDAKMREAYRRGEIDDLLKPENKTERLKELEKQFNELIARQREDNTENGPRRRMTWFDFLKSLVTPTGLEPVFSP